MTRYRKQSMTAVSLFPFLTVLISTMGVLIMMLVIGVKSSQSRAAAKHAEQEAKLDEQIAEIREASGWMRTRSAGWLSKRDELVSDAQVARDRRDYLKGAIEELRDAQHQLELELESLDDGAKTPIEEVLDATESLNAEIAELKRQLDEAQEKPTAEFERLYSVVPFEGPGGTHRRPIFVECLRDRIVLQPFGIPIFEADFPTDLKSGNALDSALSTIRQYWLANNLQGAAGAPYPLLIVRPDGSGAYTLARRSMVNWVDEFGYELVDADMNLDFGATDEELAKLVADAVQRERESAVKIDRQRRELTERFRVASAGEGGGGSTVGLEVDRVNGGFRLPPNFNAIRNDQNHRSLIADQAGNPAGEVASSRMGPSSMPVSTVATGSENKVTRDTATRDASTRNADQRVGAVSGDANSNDPSNGGPDNPRANANMQSGEGGPGNFTSGCPLAVQRGANWALPIETGGRTSYVRPITIYCSETSLIVVPDVKGNQPRSVIDLSRNEREAVDELVDLVQKRVEFWGPPPENGFWKPELRFRLLPGGQSYLDSFKLLLTGSGLEVVKE